MSLKEQKILAMIPARGGSKGIPKKNIVDLSGKPLLTYSSEIAKRCGYIDKVIVSTDSDEIIEVCNTHKIEYIKRPKKIAGDLTKMTEVLKHTIDNIKEKFDILVLLQPTSPLRKLETINKAIEEFVENADKYDFLVPLKKIESKIGIIKDGEYLPIHKMDMQRQETEEMYSECGTIFIYKIDSIKNDTIFRKIYPFIIDSLEETIDIDTYDDLKLAGLMLNERNKN